LQAFQKRRAFLKNLKGVYQVGLQKLVQKVAQAHRIIESLRLEKTSKIIKSNCHPNTPTPAKPCPEVPHAHGFLNPSRDGDSTTALGSLVQCLTTLAVKKYFLISSQNVS